MTELKYSVYVAPSKGVVSDDLSPVKPVVRAP